MWMQLEFYLSNQAYMGSVWSIEIQHVIFFINTTAEKVNRTSHKFLGITHLQQVL